MTTHRWQLRRGEESIGRLSLETVDMSWHDCRFEPSDGWPAVAPLFVAAQAAWERHDEDAALAADEAICQLGLELAPEDGGVSVTEFLLRIDGDFARFRY